MKWNLSVIENIFLSLGLIAAGMFLYSIIAMQVVFMISGAIIAVMDLILYFGLFRCPYCHKHLGKLRGDTCPHCGKLVKEQLQ